MDKQTLSNYGWLTIVTLILAVMLAFATPFGTYVGDAVVSIANGFVGASDAAIDEDNIKTNNEKWDNKFDYSGFGNSNKIPTGGKYVRRAVVECSECLSDSYVTYFRFCFACDSVMDEVCPECETTVYETYEPMSLCSECGAELIKKITYVAGDEFPTIENNDKYYFGDYVYVYNAEMGGWKVLISDELRYEISSSSEPTLNTINGKPVIK